MDESSSPIPANRMTIRMIVIIRIYVPSKPENYIDDNCGCYSSQIVSAAAAFQTSTAVKPNDAPESLQNEPQPAMHRTPATAKPSSACYNSFFANAAVATVSINAV